MKPLEQIADAWAQRSGRERALLVGVAVFALAFALHSLLYRPFLAHHEGALERFAAAEDDHLWLQARARTITGLQASVRGARLAGTGSGRLREILAESLKEYGLQAELGVVDQEEGTKQIEVRFAPAAGKDVMRWIERRVDDGHLLQRLRIEAAAQGGPQGGPEGRVSATAYFEG